MSATVVTCYYRIPSKHSYEKYDVWISQFLSVVNCNLVIFTSFDLLRFIYEKIPVSLQYRAYIIPIDFENLDIYRKYQHLWDQQYTIDPDPGCGRSKECYVLWNSKLWFLHKAIQQNPFQSDKFVWTDIGSLRTPNASLFHNIHHRYPLYDKISGSRIDIAMIEPIEDPHQTVFVGEVHFSGTIFGGHKDTIQVFHNLFYKKLDEHIQKGIFVGCDQQTISSVYNENRDLFHCISSNHVVIDEFQWFYLWLYYSNIEFSTSSFSFVSL